MEKKKKGKQIKQNQNKIITKMKKMVKDKKNHSRNRKVGEK